MTLFFHPFNSILEKRAYCIAGDFWGTKCSWLSNNNLVISYIIFLWLLLALQVKVGKVASFVGKYS